MLDADSRPKTQDPRLMAEGKRKGIRVSAYQGIRKKEKGQRTDGRDKF
jgi:hypothetical protein